jgi:hypothetical protein
MLGKIRLVNHQKRSALAMAGNTSILCVQLKQYFLCISKNSAPLKYKKCINKMYLHKLCRLFHQDLATTGCSRIYSFYAFQWNANDPLRSHCRPILSELQIGATALIYCHCPFLGISACHISYSLPLSLPSGLCFHIFIEFIALLALKPHFLFIVITAL